MVNDRIEVHNVSFIGTSAEIVKMYLKVGEKLQPIQMFGYWVNSVTVDEVDQLEFEWQDYDRFKGTFRVDPTQGVYSVKFQ